MTFVILDWKCVPVLYLTIHIRILIVTVVDMHEEKRKKFRMSMFDKIRHVFRFTYPTVFNISFSNIHFRILLNPNVFDVV